MQCIVIIATIDIIATIGIIAMMMYADEVEDGKEQVHGQCAGDLHYIPLAELLMAPITEIGPNWHQPNPSWPKVLLTSTGRPVAGQSEEFLHFWHRSTSNADNIQI